MALTREKYAQALTSLESNISRLEEIRQQSLFQKSVSLLFMELNSPLKSVVLPVSKFVHALHESSAFFKLEATEDVRLKIWRQGEDYRADSRCYFLPGELAELTKSSSFDSENSTTLTLRGYRVTAAYLFETSEPTVDVTSVAPGTQFVQVAQPSAPAVPRVANS